MNVKDNMTTPNLWDAARQVLGGKFIAIHAYLPQETRQISHKQSNHKHKGTKKHE